MEPKTAFPIIDCDGHVQEPMELWTQYLDPKYRDEATRAMGFYRSERTGHVLMMNGHHANFKPLPQRFANIAAGAYGKLGKTEESIGQGFAALKGPMLRDKEHLTPGGMDPHDRIKDMDADGIEAAVVFPTEFCRVGGVQDVFLAGVLCKAYNDWVADYCRPYPNRLFGTAVVPLQSVPLAIDEMERTARMGLRAAVVRPNFVGGLPLNHRAFEPFWSAAEEMGMPIAMHPFPTAEMEGTYQVVARWADPNTGFTLCDALCFPLDSMLTMAYMMYGGVLDRHPDLKVGVMESNGS